MGLMGNGSQNGDEGAELVITCACPHETEIKLILQTKYKVCCWLHMSCNVCCACEGTGGHYAEAKRRYTKMGHAAGERGGEHKGLMGVVFGGSSSDCERERHT
jgi:hypothetical protein